jgi:hypothetical protein
VRMRRGDDVGGFEFAHRRKKTRAFRGFDYVVEGVEHIAQVLIGGGWLRYREEWG